MNTKVAFRSVLIVIPASRVTSRSINFAAWMSLILALVSKFVNDPSGHTTLKQRRFNIDSTS